jgi:hypothetical protein
MNISSPTPSLRGRENVMFLPLQGGGEEGDGNLLEQYKYV